MHTFKMAKSSLCRTVPSRMFTVFVNLIFLDDVIADYCEFGTCEEDEYCCGDNKCCRNSSAVWYLWVLGILTLLVIFILYIWVRFRRNNQSDNQYHPLSTNEPEMEVPILAT
ncbi:unnamed protein product [Psylliodes chrysocephalus]|uniref:Uncharacterized protein n=1 Tax=Psylliodes chrysocephalus TaxID=3402493 RepID=A0A9P0CM50_9CUCU|nr:unnamed protein product [Psylliodes chrysocephala]